MADEPSRLLTGNIYYKGGYIPIAEYRDMIAARSLYNLENEYESTQLFSPNNQSNVASSISTVLNVIPQYNRMQVNTNLLGNTYDAFRDGGSPLARIGLIMLGKHMAYNSAMNLAVKYLPTVDLSQALKGNPDKIFKLNEQNTITVKNAEQKTFLDKVGSTASNFLGIDTYDVFGDANPFRNRKDVTNMVMLENTGEVQLKRFFSAVNLNPYKPINPSRRPETTVIRELSDDISPLLSGIDTLNSNNNTGVPRVFFNFADSNSRPYFSRPLTTGLINSSVNANQSMTLSYSINAGLVQEYAPFYQYIKDYFGYTVTPKPTTIITEAVGEKSNFSEDIVDQKLVWGRDGVTPEAKTYIGNLRGTDDATRLTPETLIPASFKTGLLEYTRNLLNASEGNFVDITRKAFKEGENIVGFNGSPLWKTNDSKYSQDSGNVLGKTGIRQHTILDQYDRFAKLIRFKGNIVYGGNHDGNQNSVIYDSVLPRIHPTKDDNGVIDNKNLMFSIENLAVGAIKRDKYGVIDDEYGTPIPLSEVGPFAGRQMWFPPYNIELNEVAIAKYESTVMVGRNEPMYNYMNSERTAVLSFTLLVDYPEQLRNYISKKDDKNKAIADFFAFGGDPLPEEYKIEVIEKEIQKLEEEIQKIGGPVEQAQPPDPDVQPVTIYFPNDRPIAGEENSIIDTMYKNDIHYEIINGLESSTDGNGFGLNEFVYYRTGLTAGATEGTWVLTDDNFSQYNSTGASDQFGVSELNKYLFETFNNADIRQYYKIEISGGASKLYLSANEKAYNEALGDRRIAAAKQLVFRKLATMFGETVANGIKIVSIPSKGSLGMSAAGAESKNMHEKIVKQERRATITIKRDTLGVLPKVQKLNVEQQQNIILIQEDIQVLYLKLNALKTGENIYENRNKAILNSFESVTGNQFYPAFHSQTPEDFHRRLTFLQQCTRQGAAKRYDVVDENTGELRARNSVFGRQPICILRVGDFWYTKVVIESVTIDYADTTWDMNPEGFGMQPMMANITLQMKVIGGQSLKGPIDALQNAVSFNYYANSTFTDKNVYARPSKEATKQNQYMFGVDSGTGTGGGIVGGKIKGLNAAYDILTNKVTEGDK